MQLHCSEFSNASTGIYILAQVQSDLLALAVLYKFSCVFYECNNGCKST